MKVVQIAGHILAQNNMILIFCQRILYKFRVYETKMEKTEVEVMMELKGYQKGINLGGWLSQCVSYTKEHFDTFILEDDIKKIAGWGMDHIRLPIDYDVIETDLGEDKEEGYQHIDDCIKWCQKYHLNIVLDLHKSFGYMFDKNEVPEPDKFFADTTLQERFYALWNKLAKRYACNKDFMIFELLNEVVNPDYANEWNEIAAKAVGVIRKISPDIKIIIGGVCHNSVSSVKLLGAPVDEKIVYTFHCYEPLCFTHQKAHWVENIDFELPYPADVNLYKEKSALLNQNHAGEILDHIGNVNSDYFRYMFREAIAFAKEYQVPLYCGEYGVIDKAPAEDAVRWLSDINEVFSEYQIGRALWNYKQKDFGITDEHYGKVVNEMLKIVTS